MSSCHTRYSSLDVSSCHTRYSSSDISSCHTRYSSSDIVSHEIQLIRHIIVSYEIQLIRHIIVPHEIQLIRHIIVSYEIQLIRHIVSYEIQLVRHIIVSYEIQLIRRIILWHEIQLIRHHRVTRDTAHGSAMTHVVSHQLFFKRVQFRPRTSPGIYGRLSYIGACFPLSTSVFPFIIQQRFRSHFYRGPLFVTPHLRDTWWILLQGFCTQNIVSGVGRKSESPQPSFKCSTCFSLQ